MEALPVRKRECGASAFTYREAGAGAPMVFLHGISSGSGSWVHQLKHFGTHARCIAWDAPGYGGSSPLPWPAPSAGEYGAALTRFFTITEVERPFLVAHSLGALMATSFAARHPEQVRGLLLLDPATGYGAASAEVAEKKLSDRLTQLRVLGVEGLAKERAGYLVSSNAPPEALELIRWNMLRLHPEGYTQAASMLCRSNLLDSAREFRGKVMVACGTQDDITPEASCREAAAAFPSAEYRSLPGLGHASYIEDPVAIHELLTEFMRSVPHE